MLSSVLKSERAVSMSIQVVRAFVAMRTYLMELASTSREIAELKERVKALEMGGDENLKAINDLSEDTQQSLDEIYIALTELSNKHKVQDKLRRPVGFIKPKDADHK